MQFSGLLRGLNVLFKPQEHGAPGGDLKSLVNFCIPDDLIHSRKWGNLWLWGP